MIRDLKVEATEAEGGATILRVSVETTSRPIVSTAVAFVICLGLLGIVQVMTDAVPIWIFPVLLALGLFGGYWQLRTLTNAKGTAGELRLDPAKRRVEKLSGCTSLPWPVLEVPKRALLVRRTWLSATAGGVGSKPIEQHDLLLVPYRDRDHREKLVSDFAEWHRQESLRVYKGDDHPSPARDEQLVVRSFGRHMALFDRL
jgi:hypothetical protein